MANAMCYSHIYQNFLMLTQLESGWFIQEVSANIWLIQVSGSLGWSAGGLAGPLEPSNANPTPSWLVHSMG